MCGRILTVALVLALAVSTSASAGHRGFSIFLRGAGGARLHHGHGLHHPFHGHHHFGHAGLYRHGRIGGYVSFGSFGYSHSVHPYDRCSTDFFGAVYYPARVVNVSKPVYVPVERPVVDENAIREAVRAGVRDALREQHDALPPEALPVPRRIHPAPEPSTLKQQARCRELLAAGDAALRQQNTLQAYARYSQAIKAAPDLSAPRFRQAMNLVAMRRFAHAVQAIKTGLALDPAWPSRRETLDDIYGTDHPVAKSSYLSHLASWVHEDIQDPDRLFLMGVMLHFDREADKAATCFKAAKRLAAADDHIVAFLALDQPAQLPQPAARVKKNAIQPRVYDLVGSLPPAPVRAPTSPLPPLPAPPDSDDAAPTAQSEPSGPILLPPGEFPLRSD